MATLLAVLLSVAGFAVYVLALAFAHDLGKRSPDRLSDDGYDSTAFLWFMIAAPILIFIAGYFRRACHRRDYDRAGYSRVPQDADAAPVPRLPTED